MASSRKKTEIKQAPKHLEKMLFNNYREEERLQQKIKDLTNNSRLRGYELDREKIQVHNEMRLSKRRNSSPTVIPSVASFPAAQRSPKVGRPATKDLRGPGGDDVVGQSSMTDPVNEYLLTEFKRVSEVIPAILSSLNKDDKANNEEEGRGKGEGQEDGRGKGMVRRATVANLERSAINSLAAPLVRLDPDLKAFASKETGRSEDDPDIGNIVSMIRSIKTLREDIAAKKRYDVTRARTSFNELLKNIHAEERRGSDSNTFTDGACALLRRKMHKARRASCPAIDPGTLAQGGDASPLQTGSGSPQPQRRLSRGITMLGSMGRQRSRDADGMRAMLEEEDRQLTQIKVATEWRRYDDIRTRIEHFLDDAKTASQRRASLPVFTAPRMRPLTLSD